MLRIRLRSAFCSAGHSPSLDAAVVGLDKIATSSSDLPLPPSHRSSQPRCWPPLIARASDFPSELRSAPGESCATVSNGGACPTCLRLMTVVALAVSYPWLFVCASQRIFNSARLEDGLRKVKQLFYKSVHAVGSHPLAQASDFQRNRQFFLGLMLLHPTARVLLPSSEYQSIRARFCAHYRSGCHVPCG